MIGELVGGRYEVRALLGVGGSARVWRAHDVTARRAVALKVLHPHLVGSPAAVEAFDQEARAGAQLRHPNVVPVLDSGRDGARHWLVTPLVEGVTVAEVIDGGGLAERQALALLSGVLAGLAHAHDRGLLHLDLAPANVVVPSSADGLDVLGARLLDLGGTAGRVEPGQVRVSPAFASPEAASAGRLSERSDVYSAGALLFALVAGRPPYPDDDPRRILEAHLTRPVPVPSEHVPGISGDVDAIVARSMAKDPTARYPSAAAMGLDVARARGALVSRPDAALPVRPPARVTSPASAVRRRPSGAVGPGPGLVAAAVGVLVAVAAVGGAESAADLPPFASVMGVPATSPSTEPTASPSPSPAPAVTVTASDTTVPPQVDVPDVVGLDLAVALEVLLGAGFSAGPTTLQGSSSPAGLVLAASPGAGAAAPAGSAIGLTVASGWTEVPDVAGMTGAGARAALAAAGLVEGLPGRLAPGETVTASEPEAASTVAVGTSVVLLAAPVVPPPSPSATPEPEPTEGPTGAPTDRPDPNG